MVKLQELGFKVNQEDSELVYKAPMAVEIEDDAFASLEAAMERLLDLDDVDAVYTNADGLV
jgi:transcriptional/translational regulatory protein YebC/TACO1